MVTHPVVRVARLPFTIGLLASVALGLASCQKMPLVAPSGTTINLVAETNVLPVNGSTDVIAVLVEGQQGAGTGAGGATSSGVGTPVHNGTLVTFTTSLGRIEPGQQHTSAGKATVKLIADGRSGTATITAFSGAATKTLTVNVGAAGATRILVTATPQTLPAAGGTATILANVQDQQGNGLLGVPVSFSTDVGILNATNALSDASGFATTTLSTTTGPATVTASAGGGTGTLSGTVKISLKNKLSVTITPPASATVSVPASISIGLGTGTVVTDVIVDFGDHTNTHLGAITSSTNIVHFYGDSGIFTITATPVDADGPSAPVSTQIAVLPLQVSGTVTPSSAAIGVPLVFSVTVTPNSAAIDHVDWDFGDNAPARTNGLQVNHIFGTPGVKLVQVRVVPTNGSTLTYTFAVTITP